MSFPRQERVRITAKDRRLFKSLDIDNFRAAVQRKDLSLDAMYQLEEGEGDTLLDVVPVQVIKSPYNDLAARELQGLIESSRRQIRAEVLNKGKVGVRLVKHYMKLFDTMMGGEKFSYTDLAESMKISRARLELIRDGLLRLPTMKRLIAILKADASSRYS